jgi:hypothetical protein
MANDTKVKMIPVDKTLDILRKAAEQFDWCSNLESLIQAHGVKLKAWTPHPHLDCVICAAQAHGHGASATRLDPADGQDSEVSLALVLEALAERRTQALTGCDDYSQCCVDQELADEIGYVAAAVQEMADAL